MQHREHMYPRAMIAHPEWNGQMPPAQLSRESYYAGYADALDLAAQLATALETIREIERVSGDGNKHLEQLASDALTNYHAATQPQDATR